MTATESDGFVKSNEDELKTLAEAVAEAKGAEIAGAGTALLIKVLTGSSIAAGAAEKAVATVFGRWLADTPDARLQRAAEAFREADQSRELLREFAAIIEPLVAVGLHSAQASVAKLADGQTQLAETVGARSDDLEALLGQSLRASSLLEVGQNELKELCIRINRLLEAQAAQQREAQRAKVWTVPFRSNRFFAGRDDQLREVKQVMLPGQAALVVVVGLGGIGKTQLAVEYAYASRATYEAVLWVSAESHAALQANLAGLASESALGLSEHDEVEQAAQLSATLRWLREHSSWLLVLDNADSDDAAEAVESLVQRLATGHILITSRRANWPGDFAHVGVQKLPKEVAADFLLRRTAQPGKPALGSLNEACELAAEMDGLPLALEQAAAYMLHKRLRFASYRSRMTDALRFKVKGGTSNNRSVFNTWLVTERDVDPEARAVLRLACWLSSEPIRRDFLGADGCMAFRAALSLSLADETSLGDSSAALERGILQLADYSLIDCVDSEFSMHPLVAAVQREQLSDDERRHWVSLALSAAEGATDCDPFDVRSISILAPVQHHIADLLRHADDINMGESTALLTARLGGLFNTQARYPEAEPLMRRALALAEQCDGAEQNVVFALSNLGHLLQETNRFEEAERLMRRALAIAEGCHESTDRNIGIILNSLSQLLQVTNRFQEAEPLMWRALAIAEDHHGTDHPAVGAVLNNLSHLLHVTNRSREAEPLLLRAIAICEQHFGREHPRVATLLGNLAPLLELMNRSADAETLLRRALSIDEQSHGAEHPDVARDLNNLALLLRTMGRHSEAEPLQRRALRIDEQFHGDGHPRVAVDLNNLALLLQATERLDEAEQLLNRAIDIDERSYGFVHPRVAVGLNNLAQLLLATGRTEEAEPLQRRALAIDEHSYGPAHPDVAIDVSNLALLLQMENRSDEAEPLLRRALAIFEHSYGPMHLSVVPALRNLAQLLLSRLPTSESLPMLRELVMDGKSYGYTRTVVSTIGQTHRVAKDSVVEAETLLRRALTIVERGCGSDRSLLLQELDSLAELMLRTHQLGEAERLIRLALAVEESVHGEKHAAVARRLRQLTSLLNESPRWKEAEPLLRRLLTIDKAIYGSEHPDVAIDLNNLALSLRANNHLGEAAALLQRAVGILVSSYGPAHPHTQALSDNLTRLTEEMADN